ncbi:hypothetical protein PSYJA_37644, partial [Pseudomonas syringae pv. japonica str. M301072]
HHDVYREQHTVNPWRAKDLAGYFDAARQELSSYMINTIRYGEAEGAINIERLIVEVIVPNPVQRSHSLSDIDIEAFDLGDHLFDRATGRSLNDDEVDDQDAEQGRDDQQQ